jgi:hypothetical protein
MEILVLHNSQFEHPISESGVEDYVEEQPVIPTPCRRGSACSGGVVMTTATEVDDKAEGTATVGTGVVVVVGEGGNMTTEQTSLEHHFAETRKPSVNERRLPVEATGLSIQHVAVSSSFLYPAPFLLNFFFLSFPFSAAACSVSHSFSIHPRPHGSGFCLITGTLWPTKSVIYKIAISQYPFSHSALTGVWLLQFSCIFCQASSLILNA